MGTTFTGLSGKKASDFGHGKASLITYMNVFSNPIANPNMIENVEVDSRQREVEVGDVFFTTSSETPEEVGMSSVLKKKIGITYLNSFCFGFRPSVKFDLDYLAFMLRSESVRKQIKLLAQGISRFNIAKTKMMYIDIQVPKIDEQIAIGKYFAQLDRLITLHQCNCNMATRPCEWSSGLRAIAWEQRNTSYLGNFFKGQGYSKADLLPDGTPIILYGQLYTNYQFTITEVNTYAQKKKNTILSKGNEVIVPASGETAEDIARASAVRKKGVILGGDLNIIVPIPSMNAEFFALSLSNGFPQKKLAQKAQGKSVVHIHNSDIQEISITYPSLEEQNRIASFFRHLDRLITLHQRKHILLT